MNRYYHCLANLLHYIPILYYESRVISYYFHIFLYKAIWQSVKISQESSWLSTTQRVKPTVVTGVYSTFQYSGIAVVQYKWHRRILVLHHAGKILTTVELDSTTTCSKQPLSVNTMHSIFIIIYLY